MLKYFPSVAEESLMTLFLSTTDNKTDIDDPIMQMEEFQVCLCARVSNTRAETIQSIHDGV